MDAWRGTSVPSLPGAGVTPRLWDSASSGLAVAATGRTATVYACGITPYDATHIGHAATFIAWDLLVRAWRDAGHEVSYVQNVTDVDDPLLERAARDGVDWRDLADRETDRYRSDMATLRVLPPDALVGAVEALPLIERFAHVLSDRGALYDVDGDLYFSRAADSAFGSVSHLSPEVMLTLSGQRGGDPGRPGKKDPLDPLVWLAARAGEPSWESAFGPGRPGWHVECAAIATDHLGATFDVQAGGCDLIFPHHEMSASHARVVFGDGGPDVTAFARRYAHAGMVRWDGEKMSKSRGNLVFVSDLLAGGADPMAVRLAILAHPYRHDWDWTSEGIAAATERLGRWRSAVARATGAGGSPALVPLAAAGPLAGGGRSGTGTPSAESVLAEARDRLADDLDAAGALAALDRWAHAVNGSAAPPPGPAEGALVRDTVDALLGIQL